jgi:hypothetical protein
VVNLAATASLADFDIGFRSGAGQLWELARIVRIARVQRTNYVQAEFLEDYRDDEFFMFGSRTSVIAQGDVVSLGANRISLVRLDEPRVATYETRPWTNEEILDALARAVGDPKK